MSSRSIPLETAPADTVSPYLSQQTIGQAIHCTGTGVHSGLDATIRLLPAIENSGIVFRRTDLSPSVEIPALWSNVTDTRLCTVLTSPCGTATVGTVEHLMAALSGCGIDNALIEIDGPEVPIMDGSSADFVFLIECAGIARQAAPRKAIMILKPVSLEENGKRVEFRPASHPAYTVEVDFATGAIGRQTRSLTLSHEGFRDELSRARTFGFIEEANALRAAGLALGASLSNAVVIDGDRVINEGGLRMPDEFARHKLLDAIGDLYLAGAPILGEFTGYKCGHALNNKLLRAVFATPGAWVEVPMPNPAAMVSVVTTGSLRERRAAAPA